MRSALWACVVTGVIALAGCDRGSEGEGAPIGVICAGTTADGGWNQQGVDAAKVAAQKASWTLAVAQQVAKDKAADTLQDLARRGAKVAIAHGFEYLEAAEKVAASQDGMKIAVTGADPSKGYTHIYMMDIDITGPAYQCGVLAGKLTRSGKVGFVAAQEFPAIAAGYKAFEAGVKSIRPDAEVTKAYTNSWDDSTLAKQQTEAFIQQGKDVLFQDLDAASKGVFEAIRDHNAKTEKSPVWVFGCNVDQNSNPICPGSTIASLVIRLDTAFGNVIKSAREGTFKPGIHTLNLANGETACVLNPALAGAKDVITKDIQAAVEEAGKKVVTGEAKW